MLGGANLRNSILPIEGTKIVNKLGNRISCGFSRQLALKLTTFVVFASVFAAGRGIHADSIPYPNPGTYNAVTYSFTATANGDVVAYFAGSGAGFDNQVGLLVNGVQQGGFGLDDHTSALGDALNFGPVSAGDSLVFVMDNLTLNQLAYSDPSLNVGYDSPGDTIGHNHIYATPYTATSPIIGDPGVIPAGIYVGFEDLPFPDSDFNYTDETFVVTNVTLASVPEPSTALLSIISTLIVGGAIACRRRQSSAPDALPTGIPG
jgi:hypothetical protein